MRSTLTSTSFIASLFITPFLLVIAIGCAGAGDGTSVPARIILPFPCFLDLLAFHFHAVELRRSNVEIILSIVQFPAYGAILGSTKTKRQFLVAAGILIVLHAVLSLICFVVPGPF